MSSRSTSEISQRDLLIIALAVILIAVIYLLASQFTYAIGFPLDDSWIHQTYARNLAQNGEWAFRPGIPSAGSTAPLWSALLALGFLPPPCALHLDIRPRHRHALRACRALRVVSAPTCCILSSALSLGWNFYRL